ncbi:MAG: tetratricopeptide repeat protein, partial [Chloroflexales bacterium]|nr:tetratricopeptide repeat protein [Chloroflexales bacterium]
MTTHTTIEQTIAAALPAELRSHAADLATLVDGLADPDAIMRRLAARPVLGAALAALIGQTLDVAGRALNIAGNVGALNQIVISGGYVDQVIGTLNQYTIQLPPTPRVIDPAAAQELFDALPLEHIPEVASLPPGSRMPFARNPLFVGRAADLRWLAGTIKAAATAAIGQVAAATGLGGIGKTNLATEWAYRYGSFFAGGVFWLSVADPAGVPGEIAACGGPGTLGLYGEADGLSQEEQVALVLRAWQEPIPRLIVLDNCEDEALLAAWRPRIGGGCRVLVTSRSSEWDGALGVVARRLGVLARAESIALLRSLRADLSDHDADEIARVLGDLPLALHLAGSFLRAYPQEQPASYLARLETSLLNHPSLAGRGTRHSATAHDLHIARTFALSYDRLNAEEQTDADARRLLSRAACLAPGEPFPTDLLLATLGRDLEDETARLDAQDALARLVSLGLLDREQGDALVLHRLLHAFVGDVADDPEAQGAVEQVLINAAYHLNNTGYPSAMQPIAAHLRYVTDIAAGREDERAASLCSNLAYNLRELGDYGVARPLYERALAISEQALGPSHPDTAGSLNSLAELFRAVGDYRAARPLYERALAISEQALGPSHPNT